MRSLGLPELLVIMGVGFFFLVPLWIFCFWRILTKAGLPGPLSFLVIVPIANWFLIAYLAFAEWPILREVQALRQRVAPNHTPPTL